MALSEFFGEPAQVITGCGFRIRRENWSRSTSLVFSLTGTTLPQKELRTSGVFLEVLFILTRSKMNGQDFDWS